MTHRPSEIQSRCTVLSALLAVALLSGTGLDPRFDQSLQITGIQSLQVGGIRQAVAQRPAPESDRDLRSFFSNATRITLHPWLSSSTISIVPEPTLHGKAQVRWGGTIRLAIRY
jgi:hypothetical protein